ncbi:hypothetical protein ACQKLP_14700 [Chitinophaga sp. NPDC101104]|uniref:hypothetical protein n=1 Tax=Chitinophaga sp. NPDC101104 TaxID=3390561 RepID=UPI003D07270E
MVKVYVDTSVIGGCCDAEFQEWSLALFDEFNAGTKKIIISDIISMELLGASNEVKSYLNQVPQSNRILIDANDKALMLAQTYIDEGALPGKNYQDALHIAHATLSGADVLASWNFKHLVNLERIKQYNAINLKLGLNTVEIRTPREILNVIEYEES